MNRKLWSGVLLLGLAIGLIGTGCSDDKATPTGTNNTGGGNDIQFTEFAELVAAIAPPVYSGPVAAPQTSPDSMWTDSSYPLLGKVFGENESMSLYSNINQLDEAIASLTQILTGADSMGITGDTTVTMPNGPILTIATLSSATTIPTECRLVFGFTQIDIDHLVKMHFVEGDAARDYHIGYSQTDSSETYLTYYTGPWETSVESFLYFAHVDLTDSSIEIRGAFFKDYGDQTSARWGYDIQTVNESDFAYRMSWYADDFGDRSGLGCIIGGGNKDVQFALKYRQYRPADTTVVDSNYILDQMFDGSYSYIGTGIATGYEEFVVEDSIFTLDYMPTTMIPSPWPE